MARLVCTHGNNAEEIFAVKEGVNRLGRTPDAAIKIFDKACSRAHAEIYRKGDYISVEDLGSRHGTFVNGKRISHRMKLHIGDRIDIGHTVLKLSEGEGTEAERMLPEVPSGQVNTQEISERLLAAELDLVKMRQQRPKVSLFRRLFGSSVRRADTED
jgi:pSer/pThr/pTyr-binding forkhead associated (FHA) protein